MHLLTVVAPVFGTNCYILAADDRTCVVIDAGAGVADDVHRIVAERELSPVAVLATHGHVDHTWDAAVLTGAFDVPLMLHRADAYRLEDPFGTLGPLGGHNPSGPLAQALTAIGAVPASYRRPGRIEPFGGAPELDGRSADVVLELGGVRLVARHAPGHTEGSTIYLLDADPVVAFTGDVLFASSVGRTDLPGGDQSVMSTTLRDVIGQLAPACVVLPGHGPTTTVTVERQRNPYLVP